MSNGAITDALTITNITVKKSRIICMVAVAQGVSPDTDARLAQKLIEAVPSLPDHDCVNSWGTTLGDCIAHTTLPHILEHMVIDWQVRHVPENKGYDTGLFVGTTEWANEKQGIARIELSYTDDILALTALNESVALLNAIVRENSEG